MTCVPGPTINMLLEAEKAYHELVLGRAVVEVLDQNGERVRFTAAKRDDLYQYIQWLRGQLCPDAAANGVGVPTRPVGFIF